MAAFDNTKYDVALYPQSGSRLGYRLKAYQKSEFSSFIPRLGIGDQKETDFDVLKSQTFDGFEGGEFSREFEEANMLYAIEGKFPIYGDGVLWQVNHATQSTIFSGGRPYVTARCSTKDYLFVSVQSTTGGAAARIYKIDSTGTATSLTLPLTISNTTYTVDDMVIYNNQLWVSASSPGGGGTMAYMPVGNTTVTEITGGTSYFHRMAVYRGALYGTNAGSTTPNYVLYKYTGDTTTKSNTEIARVPTLTGDFGARLFVYNGRLVMSRIDGLWAYDGIQLLPIEDMTTQPNDKNFRFACVLRGYLYYFMPDGLYRYTGAQIEKLYDVVDIGFPADMISAKNRLWIAFVNSAANGSSRYDKAMGYDYVSGTSFDGRIVAFDGKGMYTYARMSTQTKAGSPLLANEGELGLLAWHPSGQRLYASTLYDPSNNQFIISTNESSITAAGTGAGSWQLVSPILDGDFPMVNKALHNIELVLDGTPAADDTVNVQYRTSGFDGSTGWTTLGTIKLTSRLKLNVISDLSGGVTYKRIQFRVYPNTTSSVACGIAKIVVRYLIMPDYKYQWLVTVPCYGDNILEPLQLKDGTDDTSTVSTLRGNIYNCRSQTQPIVFVDVDQQVLNGAINSAVTTLVLDDATLLRSSGYVLIDDEIIYYGARSGNTLSSATRGVLGTSAASHSNSAKAFNVYPVILKKLTNERVVVTQGNTTTDATSGKAIPSEITFELQEV